MPDYIKIHNVDHQIVYVDPNLKYIDNEVEGDGSSPSNCLWDIKDPILDNKIYLIRRSANKYYAEFPMYKSYSNVTSLVIWGMPKENELDWDKLPETVKTAWLDTDKPNAYVYCNTSANTSYNDNDDYYTRFTDVRRVEFHNFVFQKSYNYCNNNYNIGFSSDYGTNIDCQNIRFMHRYQNGTSEASSFQNSGNYVDGVFSPVGMNSNYLAIYGSFGHSAKFINCQIDSYYSDNCTSYNCIDLGRTNYIYLKNITFNTLSRNASSQSFAAFAWNSISDWKKPILYAENINYRVWWGGSTANARLPYFISGDVNYATVKTFDARFSTTQVNTTKEVYYIGSLIDLNTYSPGTVVDGVTLYFPEFDCLSDTYLVKIINYNVNSNHYKFFPSYGQYTQVKNVTLTYGGTSSVCVGNAGGNNNEGNSTSSAGMICVGSQMTNGFQHPASENLVQNINVVCLDSNYKRGKVASFDSCLLDLKTCSFDGTVELTNCIGKIGSIKTWYEGYALKDSGGNLVYIREIEVNRSNPNWEYNGQPAVIPSYSSNILLGSVNTRMMPSTFSSDCTYPCTYICTNDGATGNYTVRTAQHSCTTWSIYRTGSSANCSLKLSNETTANWTFPLYIGGEPFKGISMQTSAGKHKATIYVIMHQYNDFTQIKDRLKIKIHLPDNSIVCANDGNWIEDTESQWNNIDEYAGGTAKYKCEIPFKLDSDGEIEFEYQFSWFMIGASTYIDPWPVITNVQ